MKVICFFILPARWLFLILYLLLFNEFIAAVIPEYNPYGKPGAGAPIRTESGTVLTSYHSRQV